MKLQVVVLFALALFPLCAFADDLVIEPKHASFAPTSAFSTVKQRYTITNHGSKAVRIKGWKAIAGYGEAKELPDVIPPGESRHVDIDLTLPGNLGSTLHRFALFTDEPGVERYRFTLSGFVTSLVSPAHPLLDFDRIDVGSPHVRRVELSAREKTPLALKQVVSQPDWLDAVIEGNSVVARIRKDATLGPKAGTIRVATSLPQQPFAEVMAKAIIEGRLRPSVYGVGFKPITVGDSASAEIELSYSGTSDLGGLQIDAPDGWTAKKTSCGSGRPDGVQCVRIDLSKVLAEPGRATGHFEFRMAGDATLSIPFGTLALPEGQAVRELLLNEGADIEAPIDFNQALKNVTAAGDGTKQVSTAPAEVTKIAHSQGPAPARLAWRSKNDDKVFGYVVYRATDRAGPFQRISNEPVQRSDASDAASATSEYVFVDNEVEAGNTYYYYIDLLANDGTQQRFSPVLSKKVTPP